MPGAWTSGQPQARAVRPGHPGLAIYLGKYSLPAAPLRLVFPDIEDAYELPCQQRRRGRTVDTAVGQEEWEVELRKLR
jgi:hypothetical protein